MLRAQLCCVHYTAVEAKNSMESIPAIHPAITENTENVLVKHAPQRLIIGKPISHYTSYSAMFCPLYSNISKKTA